MRKIIGALMFMIEILIISLVVTTILFFLINSIPGANAATANIHDKALKEYYNHLYGYDRSLFYRYLLYIKNIFHGDLGISTSIMPGQKINSFIWQRFGISMLIGMSAIIISYIVAVPAGLYIGQRAGKASDTTVSFLTAIFTSLPSIVFGLVLLVLGQKIGVPYVFDIHNMLTYLLPILAISLPTTFGIIKILRIQVVKEVGAQYSKFAAVKGVSKRKFVWVHALRPSSFLLMAGLPKTLLSTIIGSMFIEQIFQIPGSGAMQINSIQSKDYNILLSIMLLMTIISVISFRLRDLIYKLIDPRLRRR